jgi:hypothetical protein
MLRIILVTVLLLSFYEPVFKFQRLPSKNRQIPVLIDGSLSMSLFRPESSVVPFVNELLPFRKKDKKSPGFSFYLFGDTLKKISGSNELHFKDSKSQLPPITSEVFRSSDHILILSDANWSNSNLPLNQMTEKTIFYHILPNPEREPFFSFTINAQSNISIDSSSVINIQFDGYSKKANTVTLATYENNKVIKESSISLDSGTINSTFSLILPKTTSGKHLYRIKAHLNNDSLYSERYFFQYVRPDKFYYQIHSTEPTLDNRFITLSLGKFSEFISDTLNKNNIDLGIYFNFDNKAKTSFNQLKKEAVALFIGCMPLESTEFKDIANPVYFRNSFSPESPLDTLEIEKMPPLREYIYPKNKVPLYQQFVSAICKNQPGDTIPIIFSGRTSGKKYMVIAIKDLWKWDFLPLSSSLSEEQSFQFTDNIIKTVKGLLLDNIGNTLLSFPTDQFFESDTITFASSIPSEIDISEKGYFNFTISSTQQNKIIDTTFSMTSTGALLAYLKTSPLAQGTYSYTSTLKYKNTTYSYSDTLRILENKQELSVAGQNIALLDQIGKPVEFKNDSTIIQFLNKIKNEELLPVQEYFQITQTWVMLLLLFTVLLVEWVLRRRLGIE